MNNTSKPLIKQGWLRALLFLIPWIVFSNGFDLASSVFVKNIWDNAPAETGENLQTIIKFLFAAVGTTLIVGLLRKFIDRRSFKSLGFEWKDYENDGWLGFFIAPLLLGIGSIILILMTFLQFQEISVDPEQLMIGMILMMLVAYAEELIIRGYLLNNLMQSCNKWIALAVVKSCAVERRTGGQAGIASQVFRRAMASALRTSPGPIEVGLAKGVS